MCTAWAESIGVRWALTRAGHPPTPSQVYMLLARHAHAARYADAAAGAAHQVDHFWGNAGNKAWQRALRYPVASRWPEQAGTTRPGARGAGPSLADTCPLYRYLRRMALFDSSVSSVSPCAQRFREVQAAMEARLRQAAQKHRLPAFPECVIMCDPVDRPVDSFWSFHVF